MGQVWGKLQQRWVGACWGDGLHTGLQTLSGVMYTTPAAGTLYSAAVVPLSSGQRALALRSVG